MDKLREIIQKTWSEKIAPKEKGKFLHYFRRKERKWKSQLQKEFREDVRSGAAPLTEERSLRMLAELHEKIRSTSASKEKGNIRTLPAWFGWSAAAMLLLLAGVTWYSYKAQRTPSLAQRAADSRHHSIRTNRSSALLALTLPDGSLVKLSPGSTIEYDPFDSDTARNIRLKGKALFEVAKDPLKPFTVHAGGISTTALGTQFLVSTLDPGQVQVRLFEGKVVVHAAMTDGVFLEPGQQFILDRQAGQYTVTRFTDSSSGAAVAKKRSISPIRANNISHTSILEFSQEPLTHVLDKLEERYQVRFALQGHGFDTLLVTGKFLPSDDLSTILSLLGSINGLSFKEGDTTIVVARVQ